MKRYISLIIAFLLLAVFFPVSVHAADKTLTVYFYTQQSGVDKPIAGAEIGITKVADMIIEDGQASYILTDAYDAYDNIDFNALSVSEYVVLAGKMADEKINSDMTGVTDDTGVCRFAIEDNGLYLVQELSVQNEASDHMTFDPYIISVPLPDVRMGEWIYNVRSKPKAVKSVSPSQSQVSTDKPAEYSEPSVNSQISVPDSSEIDIQASSDGRDPIFTGDSNIVFYIAGIMFLSLFISMMLLRKQYGDRGDGV